MLALDGDAPPDWLGAWAFRDGGSHFWTALINKSASSTATVSLEAPAMSVQLLSLTGPSLESTTGVEFAAAQASASGNWSLRSRSVLRARDRVFSVDVPPASAVLLRFL
jgi:hypothetical protein